MIKEKRNSSNHIDNCIKCKQAKHTKRSQTLLAQLKQQNDFIVFILMPLK